MFSYLEDFDSICARISPMDVVTLVNKMFLTFDRLSEKHGVYKVSSFEICSNSKKYIIRYFTYMHKYMPMFITLPEKASKRENK